MLVFRVNALYGGNNRVVQAILGTFWLAQVGVYAWLLSIGIRMCQRHLIPCYYRLLASYLAVPHSSGIDGCSLIFDPQRTNLDTLSALAPILFDTAVVVLTLYKTVGAELRRSRCRSGTFKSRFSKLMKVVSDNLLLKTLVTDGLSYYIVVFTANLVSHSLLSFH